MAGAGEVASVAHELKEIERALADPARADELDQLVERFGTVQGRFDELGGYALEAQAREILAGLRFAPESVDDDVGKLSGGWKIRVALARILLMRPRPLSCSRAHQHLDIESILWLEGFLRAFEGGLIMTSHDREFMNRLCDQDRRYRRRRADHLLGHFEFYLEKRALAPSSRRRSSSGSRRCWPRSRPYRPLQGAREPRGAGASRVEELRRSIAWIRRAGARWWSSSFPKPQRSGEDVPSSARRQALGARSISSDLILLIRRRERGACGRQRRGRAPY